MASGISSVNFSGLDPGRPHLLSFCALAQLLLFDFSVLQRSSIVISGCRHASYQRRTGRDRRGGDAARITCIAADEIPRSSPRGFFVPTDIRDTCRGRNPSLRRDGLESCRTSFGKPLVVEPSACKTGLVDPGDRAVRPAPWLGERGPSSSGNCMLARKCATSPMRLDDGSRLP